MLRLNTAADERLCVKPVVVPRQFVLDGGKHYAEFFIVFTVQRRCMETGEQQAGGDYATSPVTVPGMFCKWPSFIITNLLQRTPGADGTNSTARQSPPKAPQLVPRFYLNLKRRSDGAQRAIGCGAVELRNAEDLRAASWDWGNPDWIRAADKLWEKLVTPALEATECRNRDLAERDPSQLQRETTLRDVYDQKRRNPQNDPHELKVNPQAASDLRPGYRLESVDHRDLAQAFESARRGEPAGAEKTLKSTDAGSLTDLYGVHLILHLGYYSQAKLGKFRKYLRDSGDPRYSELEEFVGQVWLMFGRATTAIEKPSPANQAIRKDENTLFALSPNDPLFNDMLRNQLQLDAEFREAAKEIAHAYHRFELYNGQTELRRQGRFIDSSRHRVPGGPKSVAGIPMAANAKQGAMRLASLTHDQTQANYPCFEQLMGQIRQHPGLMRRLALTLLCRVELKPPAELDWTQDDIEGFAWIDFVANPAADGADTCADDYTFLSAKTACILKGSETDAYFRAQPEFETSFFGKNPTGDSKQDQANWRKYHIFPPSLYTVSQDDISIAAARARMGITGPDADNENIQDPTRVDALTIYSSPVDPSGDAVSVAQALDNHLVASVERQKMADLGARDWIAQRRMQKSSTQLVSFQAGDNEPQEVLHAEQLMQGYSVFVRDAGRGTPWRSLCRRRVRVADAKGKPSDAITPPCCAAHKPEGVLICQFDEEGFLSTTVATAARPFVGQVCRVPAQPGDFKLTVLAANNSIAFTSLVTWQSPQGEETAAGDEGSVLGGNFRPRMTWQDLQSSDMCVLTPKGHSPNGKKIESRDAVYCEEIVTFPIFYSKEGLRLAASANDKPTLMLCNALNNPAGQEMPRGAELFPIVISPSGSTRFIDESGHEIAGDSLPKTDLRFTVEGERRYYAFPWTAEPSRETFVPLNSIDIEALLHPEPNQAPVAPTAIFNYLGSADLLHWSHLATYDECRQFPVPEPRLPTEAAGVRPDTVIPDLPTELSAASAPTLMGWLLSPALSSSASLVRSDDTAASVSNSNPPSPANGSATNAAVNSESKPQAVPLLPSSQPKLEVARGVVTQIEFSFSILRKGSELLPQELQNLTEEQGYKIDLSGIDVKGVDDPKASYVFTVAGDVVFSQSNDKIIQAAAGGAKVSFAPADEPCHLASTVTWTLTLERPSLPPVKVVYSDVDRKLPPQDKARFLYPPTAKNWFVEVLGTRSVGGLVGRGWPQHSMGTYQFLSDIEDAKKSRLYFDDGTRFDFKEPTPKLPTGQFTTQRASLKRLDDGGFQVVWNDPGSPGMLIAGHVTAITEKPAEGPNAEGESELSIELTDLNQQVWMVHAVAKDRAYGMIVPAPTSLPPRRLADLEIGELLVARCDLELPAKINGVDRPFLARHVTVKSLEGTSWLRASVSLLGSLDSRAKDDLSPEMQTVEGTNQYGICSFFAATKAVTASDRSESKKIKIHAPTRALETAPRGVLVITPALRVLFAETIANFVPPKDPDGTSPLASPVHSMISEMIARWNGWSLSVKPPGQIEKERGQLGGGLNVSIENYLPDVKTTCLGRTHREDWLQIPLRYDHDYEFCIRRVDLAGNHLFDERMPDPAVSKTIGGFNAVTSLYDQTVARRAERAAKGFLAQEPIRRSFTRASLPTQPMLAYQQQFRQALFSAQQDLQSAPKDVTGGGAAPETKTANMGPRHRRAITGPTYPPALPPPPAVMPESPEDIDKFRAVVFDRDQSLFVLSDVLARTAVDAQSRDASAQLLPPPVNVESFLLSGLLDGKNYCQAADVIRRHERYVRTITDKRPCFGIDSQGDLNYFGDWKASSFSASLQSDSCSGGQEMLLSCPLDFFTTDKLKPDEIQLVLAAGKRRQEAVAAGPSLIAEAIATKSSQRGASIVATLPPGVQGKLRLFYPARSNRLWREFTLVHGTNGAWARPRWQDLREIVIPADQEAPSARELRGQIMLDVPSTGSYTLHAYWNETGDEHAAPQFGPAEAIARVNDAGMIERVEIVDPGFGFGQNAVATLSPPLRLPILCPQVKDGELKDLTIEDAGADCRFSFNVDVQCPANAPSGKAKSATATALVNRAGQVERIKICDPGLGLDDCPPVRFLGRTLPSLAVDCKDGKVQAVRVLSGGQKYPDDFRLRIIRRPPLVRIAQAEAVVGTDGQIDKIIVVDRGGWYATAPIVVLIDGSGDGYGAEATAALDEAGGVRCIEVLCDKKGANYSKNVIVGIYTHQYQTPDVPLPPAAVGQRLDLCNLAFTQSLDQSGRRVDYVVRVNGRFEKQLSHAGANWNKLYPGAPLPDVLKPISRCSVFNQIELASYKRPTTPNVDYLMPAFEWQAKDDCQEPREAQQYFVSRPQGTLTLSRLPNIRVYMKRPWHNSGLEQLAVIVPPAISNTIRIPREGDSFKTEDGGAYNPLNAKGKVEPGMSREKLIDYAISKELRGFVTRWGYDPIWAKVAYPPLSADNFTSRSPALTYERIDLANLAADPNAPPRYSERFVWLALHNAQYDGAKERWYVDLRLELLGAGDKKHGLPFVQLALATYQPNGIPGKRTSPVKLCDMYKMLGDRTLTVERSDRRTFHVALSGRFEKADRGATFPRRRVIVRLSVRDQHLAPEIVGYVAAEGRRSPELTGLRAAGWPDPQPLPAAAGGPKLVKRTQILQELELKLARGQYTGKLSIDASLPLVDRPSKGRYSLVLSVEEYELYPASGGALDKTGGRVEFIDNQVCGRRGVFSQSLDLDTIK
jgi:hypothetical protein